MYLLTAGAVSGALLLGAGTSHAERATEGPLRVLHTLSVAVDVLVAAYVVSLVGLALMCAMARLRRRLTGARG